MFWTLVRVIPAITLPRFEISMVSNMLIRLTTTCGLNAGGVVIPGASVVLSGVGIVREATVGIVLDNRNIGVAQKY